MKTDSKIKKNTTITTILILLCVILGIALVVQSTLHSNKPIVPESSLNASSAFSNTILKNQLKNDTESSDPAVRSAALTYLASKYPEQINTILPRHFEKESDPSVLIVTLELADKYNATATLPTIIRLLDHEHPAVQAKAAGVILKKAGTMTAEQQRMAVSGLIRKTRNVAKKSGITNTEKTMNAGALLPWLQALTQFKDPRVAQVCLELLESPQPVAIHRFSAATLIHCADQTNLAAIKQIGKSHSDPQVCNLLNTILKSKSLAMKAESATKVMEKSSP